MKISNNKFNGSSLVEENRQYKGTGGISEGNRTSGFLPAFLNTLTGDVYPSCYSNGRSAPVHLFDGLPHHIVKKSVVTGRAYALQDGVISGFTLGRKFYTRAEACLAVESSKC